MKWKLPPKDKIHEALGCLADGRIEISQDGNSAKVYSSSKGKFYTVTYDSNINAIMSNDNGSYWGGYLGYPSIAFLMLKGIVKYESKYCEYLKDIKWKDLNQQFKNDFSRTTQYVEIMMKEKGVNIEEFHKEVENIYGQIIKLNLEILGEKTTPPKGY